MLFSEFTNYLPKILNEQLPAITAHLKMAPESRKITLEPDYYKKFNPRQSAVLMLVFPKNNEATLVLIKRNTYSGVHSAQISLPGGKMELSDKSLEATALREANEEIGVKISDIEVTMPFTEIYIPPSNFLVAPFLGVMSYEPLFVPDAIEVADIITLPVQALLDDNIVASVPMKTSYAENMLVPAFVVNDHVVWGATAMMLSELKEAIKRVV